jgi:NADH:ubiquinone oxidoreductase subunit 6 (subunit J)
LRAALVAVTLFAAIAVAVLRTPGLDMAPAGEPVTTGALADVLLGKDLLAFEVLSLLLLAAMIGAIVVARPRDFGVGPRPTGAPGDRR